MLVYFCFFFYPKSSTLVDFYTDGTSRFEPATFQMLCRYIGQCKTRLGSERTFWSTWETIWAEKQLSSKQNMWEEQRDSNPPESSNFLCGATDCDLVVCNRCSFGLSFLISPEPLILIHQSPNLQSSRMAVHKSFYEKMELFHHPQRPSIGSLPLLTHPSNTVRMTLMSEPGDMNRPPHQRVSLRCRRKDTHTHTHARTHTHTHTLHPHRGETHMHEFYPLFMFTKLTKTLRVCSCLKFSTNFQIDLGTDRSTICRKMF